MRKLGCSNPSRDSRKSLKQVVCYGSSEMTIINGCPVSQKLRCGMLKTPYYSMAMSAEYGSKFAALIGIGDVSI